MKRKVFYMSDLHLDHHIHKHRNATAEDYLLQSTHMLPTMNTTDDILILAGDIWTGYKWVVWDNWSWIKEVASRFYKVVVCHGNHCYWNESIGLLTESVNKHLAEGGVSNVVVLDNSAWGNIDTNTLFVGGTLWTDMDRENPLAVSNAHSTMVSDFRLIRDKDYRKISPQKWLSEHYRTKDYIHHVVKNTSDKNVVVVTHHAPTFASCHPRWAMSGANGYYASSLEGIMYDSPVTHWVHGHVHDVCNYVVDKTAVLCNPYGYRGDVPCFNNNAYFVIGE